MAHILAERFLVREDKPAIDLATGRPVVLRIDAGGSVAEQMRWANRCAEFHRLHHRRLAALVDYGALGTSQRFEAWESTRATAPHELAVPGSLADVAEAVSACAGTPARFPDDWSMVSIERPAVVAIAESFRSLTGCRPMVIVLWGPSRSGRTTALLDIARAARVNGLVPVGLDVLRRVDRSLLQTRSLCVLDDENRAGQLPALLALLNATCHAPRQHVVVLTCEEEHGATDSIRLDPIAPEMLINAIRPAPDDPSHLRRVEVAAANARGLPGRFVDLLWKTTRAPSSRVAEQRVVYGVEAPAAVDAPESFAGRRPEPRGVRPASAELATIRGRADAAIALIASGRHAPGVRQLRQAIGTLVRRGDWPHAGSRALALAAASLERGQVGAARTALEQARDYGERADDERMLIDVAVLSGHLAVDRARLDEAESTLAAALLTSRSVSDPRRSAKAALALGRCLFWKGRYDEGGAVVRPLLQGDVADEVSASATALAARMAVGAGDLARAMALAEDGRSRADRLDSVPARAEASYLSGFVHLAANDLEAAARDLESCVAAAASAHRPLRAACARLLLIECGRRRGSGALPLAAVRYLARIVRVLPPLVKARAELLAAAKTSAPCGELVARHAAQSGLTALPLYVSPAGGSHGSMSAARSSSPMDAFVAIVQTCQAAEDETTLLSRLCVKVQQQIHAVGLAVHLREHDGCRLLAGAGGRVEEAIAERAVTAATAIGPHALGGRMEASAPIRYAGRVLGSISARWPIGTTDDLSRADDILVMAAAAAAPIAAALASRMSSQPVPGISELRGISVLMSDLRRAIERAAPAPFAVLIEGESGSGKELVARAVHRAGLRRDRPFCTLNCAAIPDELVEAELFGHARGAFTGAITERAGVFEEANGGTLFLDEVGELSGRAQAKLLRVIQEGELRRIGENHSRRVDVRIVSATNRDLRQEVSAGRFRQDLLYRLDVIRLSVPPLRERRDDIALLVDHFWRQAADRIGSRATLAAATGAALARYDWPGNVRELQNVLAALAVRSARRGVVPPTALPPHVGGTGSGDACRLDEARRTFEACFVRAALARTGGRRARAAEELGVTRQGLTKLMTRLGIDT